MNSHVYEQIIQGGPEAIIVADRDGTIRFWNAAAAEMFGFSAEEAVGQSLDLIVPEPQRARHWAGYREVMRTGQTHYGREILAVPALRKDGARISVEFHIVLLRDERNELTGAAALMRDVTERWQRERSLRERIRALEAELEQRK